MLKKCFTRTADCNSQVAVSNQTVQTSRSDGLQPTSSDTRSEAIPFPRSEANYFLRSEATPSPQEKTHETSVSEGHKTYSTTQKERKSLLLAHPEHFTVLDKRHMKLCDALCTLKRVKPSS